MRPVKLYGLHLMVVTTKQGSRAGKKGRKKTFNPMRGGPLTRPALTGNPNEKPINVELIKWGVEKF